MNTGQKSKLERTDGKVVIHMHSFVNPNNGIQDDSLLNISCNSFDYERNSFAYL